MIKLYERGDIVAETLKNGIYVSHEVITKGRNMPTFHYHDFYEIYFLKSGERRYVVDNKIYNLKAGDIIIIDKSELHITKNTDNCCSYDRYLLYITTHALDSLGDNSRLFKRYFLNRVITMPDNVLCNVERIFENLYTNYTTDTLFSRQFLVNGAYELCYLLYSLIENDTSENNRIILENGMEKVLYHIEHNYKTKISLGDAADICNMNRTYFSRYFKKITGIGFSAYVTALRLKEAVNLLKNTSIPLSEVAYKSGFESQQHFCAVFKKETGISAGEYRLKNKII